MKAGTYSAQVLLGGDLGVYFTQVAQLAIPYFINGHEYQGWASGVGDLIEVAIIDLRRSRGLEPSARGCGGVGRYHFWYTDKITGTENISACPVVAR